MTIEDMRKIAIARGGECLSTTYTNKATKLRWKCAEGHEWEARPGDIKNSRSWCPHCSGKARLTIGDMRAIAEAKGGKCLSRTYSNKLTKMRWECSEGHTWEATPHSIKNGKTWCPRCAKNVRLTIEEMREIASSRGGECISSAYVNSETKLRWRCANGHEWESAPICIKHAESWCPYCAGLMRLTIEKMREIAEFRGGECLSDVYINSGTKLRWRCASAHEWDATPHSVKNDNTWCPYCRYKNEQECRAILEALTRKAFPKCKPEWLQGLELDGYCRDLGVAFEYNGEQHYEVVPVWHEEGEVDLQAQQARDAKKAALCEENWVVLIVVPYNTTDKASLIEKALAYLF